MFRVLAQFDTLPDFLSFDTASMLMGQKLPSDEHRRVSMGNVAVPTIEWEDFLLEPSSQGKASRQFQFLHVPVFFSGLRCANLNLRFRSYLQLRQ